MVFSRESTYALEPRGEVPLVNALTRYFGTSRPEDAAEQPFPIKSAPASSPWSHGQFHPLGVAASRWNVRRAGERLIAASAASS